MSAKRKNQENLLTPTAKRTRIAANEPVSETSTPSRRPGRPRRAAGQTQAPGAPATVNGGVSTPRSKARPALATPTKPPNANGDGALVRNADRSARRKRTRKLLERAAAGDMSDADDAEADALARQMYDDDDDDDDGEEEEEEEVDDADDDDDDDDEENAGTTAEEPAVPLTPSKRGRGRPKGSVRKRTPTPPAGSLAPHERYFFQNRPGAQKTSSNTLGSVDFLTHAAYRAAVSGHVDAHAPSMAELHAHHAAQFPLWAFELAQGFSVCLHGYGSKRALLASFAAHLHATCPASPTIVANAHGPSFGVRSLLAALSSVVVPPSPGAAPRPPAEPAALAAHLLDHLTARPPASPIHILVSPIHAPALTRAPAPSLLASLASHPSIRLLATADDPSFPLLWDGPLRERYNWVFHDATTFEPYDGAEVGSVVDSVNELMGRKGARGKGRDGVRWVLRSLPENARGVYRVLVAEILAADAAAAGGADEDEEEEEEEEEENRRRRPQGRSANRPRELPGVEYRTLYQRAVEEFLCSSEMAFRGLLKEFVDHQMLVARRDGSGAEVLAVDMRADELEGVLEDLVAE